MKFIEFKDWLSNMCTPSRFKIEKKEFLENQLDSYSRVKNEGLGIIEGEQRNSATGEWEKYVYSFDEHIYAVTSHFLNEPIKRIINPIKEDLSIEKKQKLVKDLDSAYSIAGKYDYFNDFPLYYNALYKVRKLLNHLASDQKSNKKPKEEKDNAGMGDKKVRVLDLTDDLDMIKSAGYHDAAINRLKDKYSKFEWDQNYKLFKKKDGSLNVKRVSMALEIIAKIKWTEKAPGWEYIRDIHFKNGY